MSLPRFERPSDITKQDEAWPFKKFNFYDDEDCQGLYFQKFPTPFLERLLTEIDRRADRREAAKLVLTFDDLLTPMPETQTQRDTRRNKGEYKKHFCINWITGLTWWQELPRITILDRAIVDSQASYELQKGDWDSLVEFPPWWKLPSISIVERALLGDEQAQKELELGDWD